MPALPAWIFPSFPGKNCLSGRIEECLSACSEMLTDSLFESPTVLLGGNGRQNTVEIPLGNKFEVLWRHSVEPCCRPSVQRCRRPHLWAFLLEALRTGRSAVSPITKTSAKAACIEINSRCRAMMGRRAPQLSGTQPNLNSSVGATSGQVVHEPHQQHEVYQHYRPAHRIHDSRDSSPDGDHYGRYIADGKA